VVDASGMGADKSDLQLSESNQPSWKQLGFSYLPSENIKTLVGEINSHTTSVVAPKSARSENYRAPMALEESIHIHLPKDTEESTTTHDIDIRVPNIGDFEGLTVIELLVKVGDTIKAEQSIITVECDKASMDIPSSESGIVKEFKVRLGDIVNEGSLVLVLEAPNSRRASTISGIQSPVVNVYVPSTRQYSRLNLENEILELLRGVRSRSTHWHILIGGSKNVSKLLIKELILRNQNFANVRFTSGDVLETPKDLAAILTGLAAGDILELDCLEKIFSDENRIGEILYSPLDNFELDVMIGEGLDARPIKLDLQPFSSIFYCSDINKIPMSLLNLFDVCIAIDE